MNILQRQKHTTITALQVSRSRIIHELRVCIYFVLDFTNYVRLMTNRYLKIRMFIPYDGKNK